MWSDIQMKLVVRGWMKECRFSFSEVVSPYRYTPRALFPSVKWSPPTDTLPEPYFLQWSGPPYRYTLRAFFSSMKWSPLGVYSQCRFPSVKWSSLQVHSQCRFPSVKWSSLQVHSQCRFPSVKWSSLGVHLSEPFSRSGHP